MDDRFQYIYEKHCDSTSDKEWQDISVAPLQPYEQRCWNDDAKNSWKDHQRNRRIQHGRTLFLSKMFTI